MNQQTEFSIIPEREELERIQRQLRFVPVQNQRPKVLSVAEIATFNREGYLKGWRIFSEEEIAGHRRYFDGLLQQALEQGKDSYSISSAHLKHARVYDLLRHPRIVAIVSDLLGDNVVGWGSHFFCKLPRDGKSVAWHQDASYWPLTPSKTVTVWLAIDDADRENACMRYIPRSHLDGHLPFRESGSAEQNVLNQTVEALDNYPPPVDVELHAGEISIHCDLLLHGSDANQSDRRRCGLTLRYCAADVQAHLGWNQKGVVVCGTAPADLWPGAQRPETE